MGAKAFEDLGKNDILSHPLISTCSCSPVFVCQRLLASAKLLTSLAFTWQVLCRTCMSDSRRQNLIIAPTSVAFSPRDRPNEDT